MIFNGELSMLLLGNSVVNEPLGLRIQRMHNCCRLGSKGSGRFDGAGIKSSGTQVDQRQEDASTDDRIEMFGGGEMFIDDSACRPSCSVL